MFLVEAGENAEIRLVGRFDAAQVEIARGHLDKICESTTLNLEDLDYISSAGLGVLLAAQKRLGEGGFSLTLRNPNKHIRDIFRYAGFDRLFEIA